MEKILLIWIGILIILVGFDLSSIKKLLSNILKKLKREDLTNSAKKRAPKPIPPCPIKKHSKGEKK